jgi:beta-lactamase regulating signal transducer with metallopeptidase domain
MHRQSWWPLFNGMGNWGMGNWGLGWMPADFCRTLSLVLLHSLWLGVILAAVLWACLRTIPARKTSARYVLSSLVLLAFLMSSCITGAILNLPSAGAVRAPDQAISAADQIPGQTGTTVSGQSVVTTASTSAGRSETGAIQSRTLSSQVMLGGAKSWIAWTRWVTWGWLLGVSIMLFRVCRSLVATRHLVRNSGAVPGDLVEKFEALVTELSQKLQLGRRVRLACSDWLNVPAVCGTLWPVLLMPTAMLTGIPLEQWRVILAHELAHVRRHDYFVNVFQMVIEALFFFNPAVWWISRQIRREREACCDALAVEITGQPLAVARALVNVAAWVRQGTGESPKALVAWQSVDGHESPGELTERVKRIAQPESAPRLRMPWYSLLGIFAISGLAFLCLQLGADVAVKTVANILSPRERVEKLVALDREQTAEAAASGIVSADDPDQNSKPVEPVKVSGFVTVAEGQTLPAKLSLNSLQSQKHSSTHVTLESQLVDPTKATFKINCRPPCILYVWANGDGIAPTVIGPFQIKAGKKLEPVTLRLEPGFSAAIRLVDTQKRPIAGAKVSGGISIKTQNGTTGASGFSEKTADADGMIRFDHAQSAYPYEANFDAPGFQMSRKQITLQPNQTVDWEILGARPTTGQIVSEMTGAPVANAELLLVDSVSWPIPGHASSWGSGDPRTSYANNAVLARTDADGRYVLNTLTDGVQYGLYVRSKDHRPYVLDEVVSGEVRPVIRLQPPLVVKCRILGADKLPKEPGDKDDTRRLSYGNVFRSSGSNTAYSSGISFTVKLDGEARFELRELFPGTVTLMIGSRSEEIKLEKSIEDLVIDLNKAPDVAKIAPKRKVIFQLTGLSDPAAASGKLQVTWQGGGHPYHRVLLPISEGHAETEVPIGAWIDVSADHLIGCWFNRNPQLRLEAGADPQLVEFSAVPAGAIQGRVFNPDGTPNENFDVSIVIAKTPQSMVGKSSLLNVESREAAPGKFVFQQLPLGGQYRILIRSRDAQSLATLLSDPISINEETPIQSVDLKFLEGESLAIKVRDEQGRPAANVGFKLAYSVSGDHASHGFSKSASTNAAGIGVFEHMNWETEATYRLEMSPTRTQQGQSIPLDSKPAEVTVQLKQGVSCSGVLIDVATGLPIRLTELRLGPKDYSQSGYSEWIGLRTNAQGEFHADNLEPREYRLYIEGADPIGKIITPVPGGGYSISGEGEFPTITGGSATLVRVEVQLRARQLVEPVSRKTDE